LITVIISNCIASVKLTEFYKRLWLLQSTADKTKAEVIPASYARRDRASGFDFG